MLVLVRKRGHTFILAPCTDNLCWVVIKIYLRTDSGQPVQTQLSVTHYTKRPVRAHIGRSRTCLFVRNSWNALLLINWWSICHWLTSFHLSNLVFERVILPKLLSADIFQAVDHDDLAALVLLICQQLLIRSIIQVCWSACNRLVIGDTAFHWFQSHLSSRKQYIRRGPNMSLVTYLVCGMPQGSILGAHVCQRYTGLWILSTDRGNHTHSECHWLCWSCYILDANHQASTKSRRLKSCHSCGTQPLGNSIGYWHRYCWSTAGLSLQSSLLAI